MKGNERVNRLMKLSTKATFIRPQPLVSTVYGELKTTLKIWLDVATNVLGNSNRYEDEQAFNCGTLKDLDYWQD